MTGIFHSLKSTKIKFSFWLCLPLPLILFLPFFICLFLCFCLIIILYSGLVYSLPLCYCHSPPYSLFHYNLLTVSVSLFPSADVCFWLFSLFSLDSQWHQIFQMSEGLRTSRLDSSQLEILTNQVLLCTAVLFVHCLRVYLETVDSHSGSG